MNHIFSLCATVVIVGHINYLCKDTIIEIHVMNYHRVSPSDKNVLFIPCLFLLLLCHIAGFAQDTDPFSYNAFSIPSANSAEMIRYGDLKPSLYTGAMEYSYHVYSYLDEDFTIPISLDYHFDGYRPSQHSGPYGMGWSLNCGGIITREVVGLPDEYSDSSAYGYYHLTHSSLPSAVSLKSALYSDTFPYHTDNGPWYVSHEIPHLPTFSVLHFLGETPLLSPSLVTYDPLDGSFTPPVFDHSSDIYHFHFGNIDGKFIILPNGEVSVFDSSIPSGELEIVINMIGGGAGNASIVIKTGDGYEYQFGGGIAYIDYSFDVSDDPPSDKYFSSLKLRRIVSPNNRIAEFEYQEPGYLDGRPYVDLSYNPETRLISAQNTISSLHYQGHNRKSGAKLLKVVSRNLQHISIDGQPIVSFNYGERPNQEFRSLAFSSEFRIARPGISIGTTRRLKSIVIHNTDGILIDSVRLHHSYTDTIAGFSPKMFLSSIIGNAGTFSFEYSNASETDRYPPVDCEETDHWGFWRNTQGVFTFCDSSEIHSQDLSLYNVINSNKEPVLQYTRYGALLAINYPLGGRTEIAYEQNTVNKRLDVNTVSFAGFFLDEVPETPVGGVRVARIINTSGNIGHFRDSVQYSYNVSGILHRMPRYIISLKAAHYYKNLTYSSYYTDIAYLPVIQWCSGGISFYKDNNHLGYSFVSANYADGSHEEFRFIDYTDYPDIFIPGDDGGCFPKYYTSVINDGDEGETSFVHRIMSFDGGEETKSLLSSNILLGDCSSVRGRLKNHKVYSADSILLRETRNVFSVSPRSSQTCMYNCYINYYISNVTHSQFYVDSTVTTEYFPGGGSLSDTTLYTYNALGQKTVTERRGFDGSVRRQRLRYEHESDATAPKANVSEAATTRIIPVGEGLQEYVTALRHFEYDSASARRHLPVLAEDYGTPVPWAVSSDTNPDWFSPPATDDTLQRRLSYDDNHRPGRLSLPGGAFVSFAWDTSGKYPIFRMDNGPSMTSAYEWKDRVGLTKKTDPTLRSEWYSYDDKWRLSEVRRADSVKVTAYDYHLWCEDSTAGPSYTKQTTWRTSNENNRDIVYCDGLGWPIQRVRTSTQTGSGHIVTPIRYDALRRDDVRTYLPFESTLSSYDGADSTHQSNYYKAQFGDDELYPYAEKAYGSSPAGRLLSSRQPGRDYVDSAKVVLYTYRPNSDADSILDLSVTVSATPQLAVAENYLPAGRLLLTKTTDEDGSTGEVFTDASGRTTLTRQRNGGQRLDTYRVYDLRDSLVCVLQPEGSAAVQQGASYALLPPVARNDTGTLPVIGAPLSEYAFLYAWDARGNLTTKKRPGAAAEEFIADDRGRTVLSRDGNLRAQDKWLFSEYDGYDAPLRKSLISISDITPDTLRRAVRSQVDSTVTDTRDTITLWEFLLDGDGQDIYCKTPTPAVGDSTFFEDGSECMLIDAVGTDSQTGARYICLDTEQFFYTGNTLELPVGEYSVDVATIWRTFLDDAITSSTILEEHLYDRGDSPQIPASLSFDGVAGIVAQSDLGSARNLEVWQRQLMLPPGRTVPGGTAQYVERAFYYDVPGNLVQTVETNALGGISRTSAKYDYRGNAIVTEESHSRAGSMTADTKRTTYTYDQHGRIATEDVSLNSEKMTETAFDYDILGHVISSQGCGTPQGNKLSESFGYDIRGRLLSKEAFRLVRPGPAIGGNGGGTWTPESVFKMELRYNNPQKPAAEMKWNGLISEIAHQRGENGAVITNDYFYDNAGRLVDHNRYDGSIETNKYTERNQSYDRNGNILTLKRYGATTAAPQDNLSYTYTGNKLTQLNSYEYSYDANGNMTSDGRRNLSFTWNYLNLPATIVNNSGVGVTVNYTYLADGTKVLAQAPGTTEGYAYLGTMVYKLNNGSWSLETTPFTGGRFIKNATGNFTEQRHITDHLGSTRAIVEGANYTEVEQNDYFPYGKRITDIALPITASNRWRFSGKEIQTLGGVNLIDFGARLYDEFTGRWKTQDVLSEWLSSVSPYSFCRCNSINRIDPTGMDDYRYDDKTGNFILMEKTDDETDRVLGYHYNKRKGEYEKNTKWFQMKIRMEGIEKGILNDGINFKNNDNLIIVGGYGHASVEGVESFVVKMSNMVRKEIGGAYFAKDGANSTTHITVGRYKNNTHTENRSGHGHNLWNKLFPNSRLENSLTGFFHTHPSNSSINASIRINPSQQDRNSRNSALEQMPNMQFFILTQPVYPGGDFPLKIDYTYL